jgi:uncharacterized protein with von Willebrand factor type A (vWA) domain
MRGDMAMHFRYSRWDGTQEIDPLDPEELLEMLSDDLLEDGDLRRALERLMTRGGRRPEGNRFQGLRDLLEQLRARRQEQLSRYNMNSPLDQIGDKLREIVEMERQGIEQREQGARESGAPQEMQDLMKQVADRKRQALDNLPPDAGGMMQQLLDYEFMSDEAREAFDQLVNELRQQMMGNYFQGLQQGLQGLTPEDLAPTREMVKELNKLLQQRMNGQVSEQDFQNFMDRFGGMFPEGIDNLDDLIDHLQRQAAQMASLMKSLSPEQRQALQDTMDALLRDDRLAWDLAQMAGMIEQITGQPLGQSFPFDGDTPLGLDEALEMLGQMGDFDELERQFREAMRNLDPSQVDPNLAEQLMGPEARGMLDELQRMTQLLEEAGLIREGRRDIELTPKAIRRLGEKALRNIFTELRKDRSGQHEARNQGSIAEQQPDTKAWEFGDPFLVDIGKSISNAVIRSGGGTPVSIEVKDLEIYKQESLITAATVIVLDMSYSMVRSGAFIEAKRVALALNTLIRSQFPRDYLELVVFSYFATELKPERLLQSDWAQYGRGTNIQEGLHKARELLRKQQTSNRQIILITDAQPTTYSGPGPEEDFNRRYEPGYQREYDIDWPYFGPRRRPGALEETLKEVKRCAQNGIIVNTFMMARDPSLVAFAKLMTQTNKGRVFFSTPGKLGNYVLYDYLQKKSKVL